MNMNLLKEKLLDQYKENNTLFAITIDSNNLEIYPQSVFSKDDILFFIAKEAGQKSLYLIYEKQHETAASRFDGITVMLSQDYKAILKRCVLSNHNRRELQTFFSFLKPVLTGLSNSFGFGDRIGLANPAHLRAASKSTFTPVLAQQSIRELTRTNRTPAQVMDAAVWAAFQEGYTKGFGADADHLKTPDDIDLLVANGFKMFTFDPGDYVHNEADSLDDGELKKTINNINWNGLLTDQESLRTAYVNTRFRISDQLQIQPSVENFNRAVLKYGDALIHIKKMYDHLKNTYPDYGSEVEVSVDETESVTSPFEHYFIASELKRLGVEIISLAPRFVGGFEKGIDYKGDLNLFREEYLKHLQIRNYFGNYKISLHSGSDKFSVYKIISEIDQGRIHIKTAGTSYLEALRVTAVKAPSLFREILNYCLDLYEKEKISYHVSADVNKIKRAEQYSDQELTGLFENQDCRQVLHVTFGRVLTDKNSDGNFIFKDRLIECLKLNEAIHYEIIINHFLKHLEPFKHYE